MSCVEAIHLQSIFFSHLIEFAAKLSPMKVSHQLTLDTKEQVDLKGMHIQ